MNVFTPQTVTVHMSEEEMDNFVFAIVPKKTVTKYQKELQDLVRKKLTHWFYERWTDSCFFFTEL